MLALRSEMSSDLSSITNLVSRDAILASQPVGIVKRSGVRAAAILLAALFDPAEIVISAMQFFEVNVVCA